MNKNEGYKEKNIIHVITALIGIGGAEKSLERLVTFDKDNKHIVISLGKIDPFYTELNKNAYEVHSMDWNGFNSLFVMIKLLRLFKKLNPDVIHCWMYHAAAFTSFILLVKKYGDITIWGIHHSLNNFYQESRSTMFAIMCCKFLSRIPDKILYCSNSSMMQHLEFGFKGEPVFFPNGYEIPEFEPNKKNCKRVGYVGRFHPNKNIEGLVQLIKYSLNASNEVTFYLVGIGMSEQNSKLMKLINNHKLDHERINLLGEITNMNKFYKMIDYLVLPSRTEGFPNVLCEAMLAGIRCLGTDVGDVKKIIGEKNTFDVNQIDKMSKYLIDLLDYDNYSYAIERKKLRQSIIDRFEINKIVSIYNEILDF